MQKLKGFTLIELLIVMIIISIVAGVAMITLNTNPHKQYETLANQLVNFITLAEQEAMLRPAVLSVAFTPHSFQLYTLQHDKKTNENAWVPASKAHVLPANIKISLKISHEIIPANAPPKLIITPSNDLTPFVILIGKPNENPYYQVIGKASGEVTSEMVQTK